VTAHAACAPVGLWVGDDDGDDHGVEDEAEHGGPEMWIAVVGLRVALQRWQRTQQDRQHRDSKADRDQDRAPRSPVFANGFERAEDLAVSTISITTRSRGSALNSLVASLLVSKNRIWNSRTPVTAVSTAITDWKYWTGTSMLTPSQALQDRFSGPALHHTRGRDPDRRRR